MNLMTINERDIIIDGLETNDRGEKVLNVPTWIPCGDEEAPTVHIIIQPMPMPEKPTETRDFFKSTARAIAETMVATMPQGVLDRVLGELLLLEATCFHVRSDWWDRLYEDAEREKSNPVCICMPFRAGDGNIEAIKVNPGCPVHGNNQK